MLKEIGEQLDGLNCIAHQLGTIASAFEETGNSKMNERMLSFVDQLQAVKESIKDIVDEKSAQDIAKLDETNDLLFKVAMRLGGENDKTN